MTAASTSHLADERPVTRQSGQSHIIADSITMLQRNLLHMVRHPGLSMFTILGPVVFLLVSVFVFGGAGGTATTVAMDMTEGITARFRTMAISRAAVLTGHVLGNTIQTLIAVILVLGVGLAVGFRPNAEPIEWLAAAGLIVLISFAISWLAVAMGCSRNRLRLRAICHCFWCSYRCWAAASSPLTRCPPGCKDSHSISRLRRSLKQSEAASRYIVWLEPRIRNRMVPHDRGRRVRLVQGYLRTEVRALSGTTWNSQSLPIAPVSTVNKLAHLTREAGSFRRS